MKKRAIALTILVFLLFQKSFPVSAGFNAETRECVAVVYTCLDLDAGEMGFGWGTGFFVGRLDENPVYLITNYHVISDFVRYGSGELASYNVQGVEMTGRSKIRVYFDSRDYAEAYLAAANESKDIAILKLASPTSKRKAIALCKPEDSMVGSRVYAVGYPGLAENIFSGATSSWGISDASVVDGLFSRIFTTEGTGRENIQITCDIKHGNSGGPLVNEDGAVIGVNTWGVTDQQSGESVKYAVSIGEAISMLDQNRIDYETAAPKTNVMDGQFEQIISGTIVPEPARPSFDFRGIIGIAFAAALVGVGLYLVLDKKKKNNQGTVSDVGQAAAPEKPAVQAPTPYVRSLAVQHRGMRIAIQGQQLLIGRSRADCAIVFEEQTPGVSGRHCSLSWDNVSGDFVLTDLRSTYGTFLMNGQKLTPGVPCRLRAGDSFYLGEEGNMLIVELG